MAPHSQLQPADGAGAATCRSGGSEPLILPTGRGGPPPPGLLVHSALEIATLAGGVRRGASQSDVALVRAPDRTTARGPDGPALAAWEGRLVAIGRRADVQRQLDDLGIGRQDVLELDAGGRIVTPGLIDPHTHLLFAGSRHAELRLRQAGYGYLDILAAGGGILQTVRETRAASDDELLEHGRRWLTEMLAHGVTAVEVKSGYGLDVEQELRLLRLAGVLAEEGPLELVPTFLGAHAVPPEFRDRPDASQAYLRSVVDEQLPRVVEQAIATSCDVFCERGVFEPPAARGLLESARAHGLDVRLHADELAPSGGAQLAAELGALSADHLAAVDDDGIEALGRAADEGRPVVATLLPATTLYLLKDSYAPARALIERGVPVALGTDFNPGTSPTPNLQLVLSLACLKLGLTPAEALAAVTINAAAALGLAGSSGSLEVGKHADLVIWDVESHELLPYWVGAQLARAVVKRGRLVYSAG